MQLQGSHAVAGLLLQGYINLSVVEIASLGCKKRFLEDGAKVCVKTEW
jgi:hypothetical protein